MEAHLLRDACRRLVRDLDADACAISRVLGDLLIQVVEEVPGGGTLVLGQGFLIPDYPLTQHVLDTREPCTVWAADPGADPAEAQLLRALGYDALLMLPYEREGNLWGLVEVYANGGRRFEDGDVERAVGILAATSV